MVRLLTLVQLDPLFSKLDLPLAESSVDVCVDEEIHAKDHLVHCLRDHCLDTVLLLSDLEVHLDDSLHWNWCPIGGG